MSGNEGINIFEKFGRYYDKMIPWATRLKKEEPFFRDLVARRGSKSVLDVGCGTGRHPVFFAEMGLQVTGVDPSPEMVSQARRYAEDKQVQVSLSEAGMGNLEELGRQYDLLTCLGNTLAHMRDEQGLRSTLEEFYRVLEPNGTLVIQMRNYYKVFRNRERFMPLNSYSDEEQDLLFLRMTELLSEDTVRFSILIFHREKGSDWQFQVLTEPLAPWRREKLTDKLAKVGFQDIQVYGNYQKGEFQPDESADLIIVACK